MTDRAARIRRASKSPRTAAGRVAPRAAGGGRPPQAAQKAVGTGRGLTPAIAIALAVAAFVLSFAGLHLRASAPPLPGAERLVGQLGWSAALAVAMLIAAYVVRGVLMSRLQYALVLSLLIHLLLVAAAKVIPLDVRLVARAEVESEIAGAPVEEETLTVPDYGDLNSEQQPWEVMATETPEVRDELLQRQRTEPKPREKPLKDEPDTELDLERIRELHRRQEEIEKAKKLEIERKRTEAKVEATPADSQPSVKTPQKRDVELQDAVELAKRSAAKKVQKKDAPVETNDPLGTIAARQPRRHDAMPRPTEEVELTEQRPQARPETVARAEPVPVAGTRPASSEPALEAAAIEPHRQRTVDRVRKDPVPAETALALLDPRPTDAVRRPDARPDPRTAAEEMLRQPERSATVDPRRAVRATPEQVAVSAAAAPSVQPEQASAPLARTAPQRPAPRAAAGAPSAVPSQAVAERIAAAVSGQAARGSATEAAAMAATSVAGGERVPLARSSSATGRLDGRQAAAEGVAVGTVAEVGQAELTESPAAGSVARNSGLRGAPLRVAERGVGDVPVGGDGTAIATAGATGRLSRASGGAGDSPRLGAAPAVQLGGRSGAAGADAAAAAAAIAGGESVAVAAARSGTDAVGKVLQQGPRGGGLGRRSSAGRVGPAAGRSAGIGQAPSVAEAAVVGGPGGSGLSAARATEPSAELGKAAPLGSDGSIGKATTATRLPGDLLRAEQTGALVLAGPTAPGVGGSGADSGPSGVSALIDGPRASLGKRRTGLPGRVAGRFSGAPAARLPSSVLAGPARGLRRTAGPVATLAPDAERQFADLAKSATRLRVPGAAEVPAALSMRRKGLREKAAATLGGSPESERAVELGLKWLAAHQHADGHWSIHAFDANCRGHRCSGTGSFEADPAATGLALLAFLGAGHTHREGDYRSEVARGLQWLVDQQADDGRLYVGDAQYVLFYSHGMATIALCEAYGLTHDESLREPCQRALQFITDSQHPQFGGWRYRPRFESDTSVSGWQLMALKSGQTAGLSVPAPVFARVSRWLKSAEKAPGIFAYHPTRAASLPMTAEGLLMLQYLGADRNDPRLRAGADHLAKNLPSLAYRDVYYWYYATQVMFHMQGRYWEAWNGKLRDMLIDTQEKTGGEAGSWDPLEPVPDRWGKAGGRVYVTCLRLLTLEVYYRHLPLYLKLESH